MADLSHNLINLTETIATTSTSKPILIIFVNGLILPQSLWTPTIELLETLLSSSTHSISALTYDRYGQGQSRPTDPTWKPEPHDLLFAVEELHSLISHISTKHFPHQSPILFLISQSIGVPLARLYDQHHPGQISAHLFLDSNIANTDFISIYPDPDAPDFNASTLPSDTTINDLQTMRERTQKMFHPSVPNAEGLDRSNLAHLLPHADKPALHAPHGKTPFVTVVGHDPEAFAEEGLKLQGAPKGLNLRFMQPFWHAYNDGLCKLTGERRVKGVVIAEGAGHFVQRDNPRMVAQEIKEVVYKMINEAGA